MQFGQWDGAGSEHAAYLSMVGVDADAAEQDANPEPRKDGREHEAKGDAANLLCADAYCGHQLAAPEADYRPRRNRSMQHPTSLSAGARPISSRYRLGRKRPGSLSDERTRAGSLARNSLGSRSYGAGGWVSRYEGLAKRLAKRRSRVGPCEAYSNVPRGIGIPRLR
jgi:hypothetical protein